jgi:hypothetical protein
VVLENVSGRRAKRELQYASGNIPADEVLVETFSQKEEKRKKKKERKNLQKKGGKEKEGERISERARTRARGSLNPP